MVSERINNTNAATTTAVATAAGAGTVTVVSGAVFAVGDILSFGGTAGNATNIECYQNMDNNATTGSGGFTNKAFYARFTYEAA